MRNEEIGMGSWKRVIQDSNTYSLNLAVSRQRRFRTSIPVHPLGELGVLGAMIALQAVCTIAQSHHRNPECQGSW